MAIAIWTTAWTAWKPIKEAAPGLVDGPGVRAEVDLRPAALELRAAKPLVADAEPLQRRHRLGRQRVLPAGHPEHADRLEERWPAWEFCKTEPAPAPTGGVQLTPQAADGSLSPAVKVDRLQHLTAFANAHATLVGDVPVPDGVVRVETNAVGEAAVEVGPNPPVRQAAVGRDGMVVTPDNATLLFPRRC